MYSIRKMGLAMLLDHSGSALSWRSFTIAVLAASLFLLTEALSNAAPGDPAPLSSYRLEAEGLPIGFFTSVTGIGSENEIIEHKVVDPEGNEVIRKIPGRLIWSDVTLKRGITSNMDLWEWRKQVEDAQTEEARRNFIITLLDEELRSVAAWGGRVVLRKRLAIKDRSAGNRRSKHPGTSH
jgi:phage tail-like protein